MRQWLLVLLATGCGDPRSLVSDGGVADAATGRDLAAALPSHCPCPLNSYCDLATNSCKAGCLGDDHCPSGYRCDTHVYQCILVCNPSIGCENHLVCRRGSDGFYTCDGCAGGYDDCNHDLADGCETRLNTDSNCGKCGGAPNVTCYQDKDGDRYVVSSIATMHCGICPAGQTAASEMKQGEDCDDNDYRVHPDQTTYFTTPTSTSGWDFNCDGFVEKWILREVFHGCGAACDAGLTWTNAPPQCGEFGEITQCLLPVGGSCHTVQYTSSDAQRCR